MSLYSVFQLVVLLPLGLWISYLAFLSLSALGVRRSTPFASTHVRRFAVIVPAHNEELAISETVNSILAVSYPRDRFDVIVVADNCTDRTAEIASALGATVHERVDLTLRGKGYALRWIVERLLAVRPAYDAFVIIDADSTASPEFLTIMNAYLEQGSASVQSMDIVKAEQDAWSPQITEISFLLTNVARPLGRKAWGLSAGLKGNGMCFRRDVMERFPWDAYSLAEDAEFGIRLLLEGISTSFAHEAIVHAKMPRDPENARSQRARWERGRVPLIRRNLGGLLRLALRSRSFVYLDAAIELTTPSLVNMLGIVLLMITINALAWLGAVPGTLNWLVLWSILAALMVVHVIAGMRAAGAPRSTFLALLNIPRYVIWKIGLYRFVLKNRGNKEWVRTTRER